MREGAGVLSIGSHLPTVMITSIVPLPPLRQDVGPSGRSDGIHLGRIIKAIATESGILKPEFASDLGLVEVRGESEEWWASLDTASRLRMSIGLAWDEWYTQRIPDCVPHPGEMCVDGIYMTHDGESVSLITQAPGQCRCGYDFDLCCHEVKVTYKSVNTVGRLAQEWLWLTQLKGYCKGLGTRHAFLHVLFLCGDYKYPITPQIGPVKGKDTCYQIEFTQAEIDENWELITDYVRHRQLMEREAREDAGLEGGA